MNYTEQKITDTLESNYMPYAMSVILSRALPEIDGFKPSHRKLLYTMYKMNLIRGAKTKSANVVGQTMKLNPHGDQAIYATMVRLTRGNQSLLYPLVDSKGNFGKVYSRDMKHAAARYTEVKLCRIAEELFKDIDKGVVDFVDNYDGTMLEPTLLPVRFPNILVNPNRGIAVGMASNICSFNLKEVAEFTMTYMKNPHTLVEDYIQGPDFPTGGEILYDKATFKQIYETGQGTFRVRSRYEYQKKDRLIEIKEIPYTTTTEAIIEKIIDLIKAGKIKDISDVRDETDLKGLKITIDLKKGVDPDRLMARLFKETPLEDTFSCNFNIVVQGKPRVMGVREILDHWLAFRRGAIKRGLAHDVERFKERLHLALGLKAVLMDIDQAIEIIRGSSKDEEVVPNLMTAFGIDLVQAEYVANIKLRNINQEYILDRVSEVEDLNDRVATYMGILESQKEIDKIIRGELKDIAKKYSGERKSLILHEDMVEDLPVTEEIEDYNLEIFFTDHNYLKKVSLVSLRAASVHKLKDDDEILQRIEGTNLSEIILFSDKGNIYKIRAHELKDSKASELGDFIPNIVDMEKNERIIHILVTRDYAGHMVFGFQNGKMAKVPLTSYQTKTNRKKLVNGYNTDSPLVRMLYCREDRDILVYRLTGADDATAVLLNTGIISEKAARNTKGIQVLRMKEKSVMANFETLDEIKMQRVNKYRTEKIPVAGLKILPMNI